MALTLGLAMLTIALVWGWRRRGQDRPTGRGPQPAARLGSTAKRLYTRRNFFKALGATGGAAVLVYSGADEAFEKWHSREVRNGGTEKAAHLFKEFGENEWVGVWLGLSVVDSVLPSTPLSRFGRQCFEATAVGLPALWTWQRTLGASRPTDDKPYGPRYMPFSDANSVSGHTFIGAIPFLTAARSFGAPAPKTLATLLSPWTGWSRLHDRKHYLSQVLLGYGLAWEAVRATDSTDAISAPE